MDILIKDIKITIEIFEAFSNLKSTEITQYVKGLKPNT